VDLHGRDEGVDVEVDILSRWPSTFPQSEWNETYRAWELPVANFEDVKLFCDKMFGKVSVQSMTLSIHQLKINFEGQS
jgi:hypothetical protein